MFRLQSNRNNQSDAHQEAESFGFVGGQVGENGDDHKHIPQRIGHQTKPNTQNNDNYDLHFDLLLFLLKKFSSRQRFEVIPFILFRMIYVRIANDIAKQYHNYFYKNFEVNNIFLTDAHSWNSDHIVRVLSLKIVNDH